MQEFDINQEVAELKRIANNQFHTGSLVSISGNQAIVDIAMSDPAIRSGELIMIGRNDIEVGEPVFVILPDSDPSSGFAIAILPKPPSILSLAGTQMSLDAAAHDSVNGNSVSIDWVKYPKWIFGIK